MIEKGDPEMLVYNQTKKKAKYMSFKDPEPG